MYAWDVCIVHIFYLCNYMWRPDIDVWHLPQSISTSLFAKDSSIHPSICVFIYFLCVCLSAWVCATCMWLPAEAKKVHRILLNLELQVIFIGNRIWFLWKSSQYFCIFVHFSSCFLVFIVLLFFSLWVGNRVSHKAWNLLID